MQVRLDIVFDKFFNLSELNNNNFYVPIREKETDVAVNDMFFLSNYNNAISFSQIYDLREQYSIRPPVAAKQHLSFLKLNIEQVLKFQKDFNIVRNSKKSLPARLIIITLNIWKKFVLLQQSLIKKIEKLF